MEAWSPYLIRCVHLQPHQQRNLQTEGELGAPAAMPLHLQPLRWSRSSMDLMKLFQKGVLGIPCRFCGLGGGQMQSEGAAYPYNSRYREPPSHRLRNALGDSQAQTSSMDL